MALDSLKNEDLAAIRGLHMAYKTTADLWTRHVDILVCHWGHRNCGTSRWSSEEHPSSGNGLHVRYTFLFPHLATTQPQCVVAMDLDSITHTGLGHPGKP